MSTSPTSKLGIALPVPGSGEPYTVSGFNAMITSLDTAAGFTIVANEAARPASPWTGQVIYQTDVALTFMWDGAAWAAAGGGGGSIEISATAPVSPSAGDLWWDSDNGNLYIYYDDGDSQQWVAANGPQVFVGTAAPAGYQGQLWFDSTTGKVYIYYDDGTSSQWVSAIGGSIAGTIVQVVSTTKTNTFSTSSTSFVDLTGLSVSITPSSTASKILVLVDLHASNSGSEFTFFNIVRDSTDVAVGTGGTNNSTASIYRGETMTSAIFPVSTQFLDSPSSTSSLTYKIQMKTSGGTALINRRNADLFAVTVSSITVMEVAG